ncbi:hypothetical protein CDL12_19092 [Handroanthus impetiginosus]|uniref:Uncharacterized protein n=1 Tax=Handroanthus impetiginosus TaxID=429701 RepID=A0A2G9GTI2_9LAMI|nr:hypothetical protein CDL12_19092 [Handroanthus impetiginosus]
MCSFCDFCQFWFFNIDYVENLESFHKCHPKNTQMSEKTLLGFFTLLLFDSFSTHLYAFFINQTVCIHFNVLWWKSRKSSSY